METPIRKYPIGQQDFEYLRKNDFLYVDKTGFIYPLVTAHKQVFLSRPRRFGKSLFLSTLKYYFKGRKDLFNGLKISELEKDWTEYPVLHIELKDEDLSSAEKTENYFLKILREKELEFGISTNKYSASSKLDNLIYEIYKKTGKRVVLLIDNSDKPLRDYIENCQYSEKGYMQILRQLHSNYGTLKGSDQYLHFVFMTGTSIIPCNNWDLVSVNHLCHISLFKEYAQICGISEAELLANFQTDIELLATKNKMTIEATVDKLRNYYGGYHFYEDEVGLYSPFSLLNAFQKFIFESYWFQTGTPAFLIKMLKNIKFDISHLENNTTCDANDIMQYPYKNYTPIPVLYQSGYLTIKSFDEERNQYVLGFPNEEVKYGFLKELLPIYLSKKVPLTEINYNNFVDDLLDEQIDTFMERLKVFFSGFSYDLENKTEKHYQTVFYILFALMGQRITVEPHYAVGRPDAVVEFKDKIFIFEFKMDGNGTAEDALKQIDNKDYAGKFNLSDKKVFKIGVEMDNKKRNVKKWVYSPKTEEQSFAIWG